MDVSRFRTSDWLKVGGGALFLIAGFLTWWKAELEGFGSDTENAFGWFFTGTLPWLIFIVIAVVTFLVAAGIVQPPTNFPMPVAFLIAAAIGFVLFIVRFFSAGFDQQDAFEAEGGELTRGIGLWLALIGAVAVLAGCFLAFTESGQRLSDLADRDTYRRGGSTGGYGSGTTPPPPPPGP